MILIIRAIRIVRTKCIYTKVSFSIYKNATERERYQRETFWQKKTNPNEKRRRKMSIFNKSSNKN